MPAFGRIPRPVAERTAVCPVGEEDIWRTVHHHRAGTRPRLYFIALELAEGVPGRRVPVPHTDRAVLGLIDKIGLLRAIDHHGTGACPGLRFIAKKVL